MGHQGKSKEGGALPGRGRSERRRGFRFPWVIGDLSVAERGFICFRPPLGVYPSASISGYWPRPRACSPTSSKSADVDAPVGCKKGSVCCHKPRASKPSTPKLLPAPLSPTSHIIGKVPRLQPLPNLSAVSRQSCMVVSRALADLRRYLALQLGRHMTPKLPNPCSASKTLLSTDPPTSQVHPTGTDDDYVTVLDRCDHGIAPYSLG